MGVSDQTDVAQLFHSVFGGVMSPGLWHWKYGNGRGMAKGLRLADGALMAHYGGALRSMTFNGQQWTAAQVVDVMVHPSARTAFSRNGVFARVARGFFDQYYGDGRLCPFGFGFPNARHSRLGQILGLYWPGPKVWSLRWHTGLKALLAASDAEQHVPCQVFEPDLHHPDDVCSFDALCEHDRLRHQRAGHFHPVKNSDWWRHRFSNHPGGGYRLYAWRHASTGQWMGAAAFRGRGELQDVELMDWVGLEGFGARVVGLSLQAMAKGDGFAGVVEARPDHHLLLWASDAVLAELGSPALECAEKALASEMVFNRESFLGMPVSDMTAVLWMVGGDTDFR